ncbi:kinase-like domain-containing protein [Parachaetomium inaequale]|uniref:Kinase-like domain-containing protein n=1 Tax=Parachaetomium inaequale TaxID=2588326 RepID=A0AAN6SSW7_9PEZI|nr:kinase-like domain-containing protein [Parachaetomium inaequale]
MSRSLECKRLCPGNLPRGDDGALATWRDGDDWCILRPSTCRDTSEATYTGPDKDGSTNTVRLVHQLGSSSAVWAVGHEAFFKAKSWSPGLKSEARTIAFVTEHRPQIPVPDVLHEYIDGDRSFSILRRVPGRTLRDSWADLSSSSRDHILATVVDFCVSMAAQTAPCMQSATGGPIDEPYLSPDSPRPFGPLTVQQCAAYFSATSTEAAPDVGAALHFYHADLGPSNIMVSAGAVTGILDWEGTGFFPRFWISTKPSVSPGLNFIRYGF